MIKNRNRYFSAILVAIMLGVAALPARPQAQLKVSAYKREPSSKALKWANEQLHKMSLEEKVGQLISVGVNATFLNQDFRLACKQHSKRSERWSAA